ncbi:hypothetical protein NMS42_002158 [Vibrio cholerae]|nr:hypothetical protein [Vibrio cholerae]
MLKILTTLAAIIFSPALLASSANANNNCESIRDMVYTKHLRKVIPYKQCVINASETYQVPEWVLLAVIKQENGPINGYLTNSNGTKDYGLTCINDVRFQDLHKDGFDHVTPELIMSNPCAAIITTAYFLKKDWFKERKLTNKDPDWLTVIGNYHYHYKGAKPKYHEKYKSEIKQKLEAFAKTTKACDNTK